MSVRRELFRLWCALTGLVWMAAIFGGDGARIARQFQAGGWRAAFVHFTIVLIIAVATPLAILLVGRAAFWISDRISQKRTRTVPPSN